MVVLSKKRVLAILSCVFISTFVFVFQVSKKETVSTVALPVSNKVIILDARAWKTR